MLSAKASAASGLICKPMAAAAFSTKSSWPAPSQIAGSAKLFSIATALRALLLFRRASGLLLLLSSRWQLAGIKLRQGSSWAASSLGQALQKGLFCKSTKRSPAPSGGVRASLRAWAASALLLPSRRLRFKLCQAGSTTWLIKLWIARSWPA